MRNIIILLFILIFFNGCDNKEKKDERIIRKTPFIIKCENRNIPEFTLSYNSNPTKEQVNELCVCLWNKLDEFERDTIIKITSGKESEINWMEKKSFPLKFGKRINECGGKEL